MVFDYHTDLVIVATACTAAGTAMGITLAHVWQCATYLRQAPPDTQADTAADLRHYHATAEAGQTSHQSTTPPPA